MVANIVKSANKFNFKKVENQLKTENEFIKTLFKSLPISASALQVSENAEQQNDTSKKNLMAISVQNGTSRAQSLEELQNKLKSIQSKKKLNYKEKLLKKSLKNKMKKKSKKDERSLKQKLIKVEKGNTDKKPKIESDGMNKNQKPIFNSAGKMVFSKFDFSGLGNKRDKKTEKDPKKLLEKLQKQKEKFKELEAEGQTEAAAEIKEKHFWKNALAKAEGEKVKDDPMLLKKSIKKRDQIKKTSQKKWKAREEGVKKAKEERQRKRNENIAKRKKDNKTTKLKKAAKKGRIIPGF